MKWARRLGAGFWNLPLVWKLLVPLVGMTLAVGLIGAFVTVRHLTQQAEIDLERELLRRSVTAQSAAQDVHLDLADSVRLGANIEGVPEALARGDGPAVRALMASVVAARPDLDLLVVTGLDGTALVEILRGPTGLDIGSGKPWLGSGLVVSADAEPSRRTGLVRVRASAGSQSGEQDRWVLATAGPVSADGEPVGGVIAGIDTTDLVRASASHSGAPVQMYAPGGDRVASSGEGGADRVPVGVDEGAAVRRNERRAGEDVATLYSGLRLGGDEVGTLAVTVPTGDAFAGARGATARLTVLILAAMAGLVALGAVLSRLMLAQVRPLVDTNRALGRGDLAARAPVRGRDELGELARGMNVMAEQLEAAQVELEMRVAARTEELERLSIEILRAAQGRSQFLAEIVHEFRNQLFSISAYAEFMLDPEFELSEPGWRFEYGKAIGDAATDLRARVDEILDLAQHEAGKMHFAFEGLSLSRLIEDLAPTIVALARRGDLTVALDVARSLPLVKADPARLRQIVLNLVSNAVKYTPPGGHVTITARRRQARVEVNVEDTGIGIPPEVGDRVFEPFYRATGAGGSGFASSGLGLAITKRLVEGHGGRIWYSSTPDLGTTFMFSLPVLRSAGTKGSERRSERNTRPGSGAAHGRQPAASRR